MNSYQTTFDIKHFLDIINKELSLPSPQEIQSLKVAFQSIKKRQEYCEYHYAQFILHCDKKALLNDRFNFPDSEEISIRTVYEANAIGFLQNLHALFDSLPYILNIVFREYDIEDAKIGWNKDFKKVYQQYDFYEELDKFFSDDKFGELKGLVNRNKHKHLTRIKNDSKKLFFEEFEYSQGKELKKFEEQEVRAFMVNCHDELMPKYLSLLDIIIKYKELVGYNNTLKNK